MALLAVFLISCDDTPLDRGTYSASVTLFGEELGGIDDMLYYTGDSWLISSDGLDTLLEDATVESSNTELKVTADGIETIYYRDGIYGGGKLSEVPVIHEGAWYIPSDGIPYGFLVGVTITEGAVTVVNYDTALEVAAELASDFGGSLIFTGDKAYDRVYFKSEFPVWTLNGTHIIDREGESLYGPYEGWLRDEGDYYLQETEQGFLGWLGKDGESIFDPIFTDISEIEDTGFIKLRLDTGMYAIANKSGVILYQPLDNIGGFMDVGTFVYPNGSSQGVISGTIDQYILLYGDIGFVVMSEGLYGAISFTGEVLVPFLYEALFPAPYGDRPGWYGKTAEGYDLLMPLPSETSPVLSQSEQAALSGATLVLLQRQGEGARIANVATGTAYSIPRETADSLFGDSPLFTLVTVQTVGTKLAASNYPTPAYAVAPVLEVADEVGVDGAALSYPSLLATRLLYSGGQLGIEQYTVDSVSITEQGEAYFTMQTVFDITPQEGSVAWGVPAEDGIIHDISATLSVFVGVDDDGTQLLCAVRQGEELWYNSPFTSGPLEVEPPQTPTRYEPEVREDIYSALAEGWIEQRVFYEDEDTSWISARSLVENVYITTVYTMSAQDGVLTEHYKLENGLGWPEVFAVTEDGLFVTTWQHVFASSGSTGDMGIITKDGFEPLLSDSVLIGIRGNIAYLQSGYEVYELNTANKATRLLTATPENYLQAYGSPIVQGITNDTIHVAWPTSQRLIPDYEVYKISTSSGEMEMVYP